MRALNVIRVTQKEYQELKKNMNLLEPADVFHLVPTPPSMMKNYKTCELAVFDETFLKLPNYNMIMQTICDSFRATFPTLSFFELDTRKTGSGRIVVYLIGYESLTLLPAQEE